jgi:putative transposase
MTAFNSKKENVLHYLTFVTFKRIPIFKSDISCQLLIETLMEVKEEFPFKLVAYVIMLDHLHLIVNPQGRDIEAVGKALKGKSAKKILDWLKVNGHIESLSKLKRINPKKRNHSFSVWQKGVKSVDLESQKFVLQKTNYTHMNPVRAGLCTHPADWKWSSYGAYFPHEPGDVPIEIDIQPYWQKKIQFRPRSMTELRSVTEGLTVYYFLINGRDRKTLTLWLASPAAFDSRDRERPR